ncbi:MAG TPA: homoserine O-acetyltransferase [Gammaproteobacteria bacterium]|nr:MAG: homoserine O-acetyltransferase [OM182 bacterium]HAL41535.1 homoserine O-acetyltransferase [Gammaproteobacteria bacterium]HBK19485.1 homoserine O-acetyltransferase [Gammaproteobacteria bacterium]|tara:strand:+ start:4561 stop:5721 length:1161 start_codon:yes stop_codon:yes gene_type:complete
MSAQTIQADAIGLVEVHTFQHGGPLVLQNGATLQNFELVYETYGQLNSARDNAILICHALSGHHHAAGRHHPDDAKPGWWDACIGPGKAIDTNQFFVLSLNNLGGCHGSTGPKTINPETGKAYGPDFPQVVVRDWVTSQAKLADHLGIETFAAVIGGSLGGMQAMQWAIEYPDRVRSCVIIAAAAKLSAQNIAFNEIARQAIVSDQNYLDGRYEEADKIPNRGLMLARMIGHVTYLSDDGMGNKFGREVKSGEFDQDESIEFQVESYLHYQGRAFSKYFDANTYMLMTHALDQFDPARGHAGDLAEALSAAQARFLVLSFSSDWRFSSQRSQEIIDALITARKNVASAVVESEHGHDSFLLPLTRYTTIMKTFLQRVLDEMREGGA